jgi:serine/threonine protein kinase
MTTGNLAGTTIAGYRLLERVGEGGTAEVYRAEHGARGACAFKVLRERLRGDPTVVKRFLREAGYGSRVIHPGVVRTYDFGEADGLYYLALEWANGEPLADFLHREGPLAPAEAVPLVRQLADALAAAHNAGIIHRDLKPENIMYDAKTDTVKLLDFGIARDAEQPPEERLTRTGFFVGTLQYVAPEALSGELVDGRADIYAWRRSRTTCWRKNARRAQSAQLFAAAQRQSDATPGAHRPQVRARAGSRCDEGAYNRPIGSRPTAFADELAVRNPDAKSRGWLGTLKNIVGKGNSE